MAGNRPLVLEQATRLVSSDFGLSVEDAARGLTDQPQLLLMLAEPAWKNRLTTRYSDVLKAVYKENPLALTLLAMSGICQMPEWQGMIMFHELVNLRNDSLRHMAYERAVASLTRHNLIDTEIPTNSLRINPIVRAVVRSLMGESLKPIVDDLRRIAARQCEKTGEFVFTRDIVEHEAWVRLAEKLETPVRVEKLLNSFFGTDFFELYAPKVEYRYFKRSGGRDIKLLAARRPARRCLRVPDAPLRHRVRQVQRAVLYPCRSVAHIGQGRRHQCQYPPGSDRLRPHVWLRVFATQSGR
jgi:hypothetical protein